jgi:hypothetical protein
MTMATMKRMRRLQHATCCQATSISSLNAVSIIDHPEPFICRDYCWPELDIARQVGECCLDCCNSCSIASRSPRWTTTSFGAGCAPSSVLMPSPIAFMPTLMHCF